MITNQRDLRRLFWAMYEGTPGISRKRGRDGDYFTWTLLAWCEFVDGLARDGEISFALAQKATL